MQREERSDLLFCVTAHESDESWRRTANAFKDTAGVVEEKKIHCLSKAPRRHGNRYRATDNASKRREIVEHGDCLRSKRDEHTKICSILEAVVIRPNELGMLSL